MEAHQKAAARALISNIKLICGVMHTFPEVMHAMHAQLQAAADLMQVMHDEIERLEYPSTTEKHDD